MIILDTNILFVLLDPDHPDLPIITTWQQSSVDQDFRMAVISQAEIAYGVAILPEGARKDRLHSLVEQFFASTMAVRLTFGDAEALAYAHIMADRRRLGRPISILDAQIAATALTTGATLATRNTPDFTDCGLTLVNPYTAP